ncbi:MAG: hypothetical protein DRQ89_14425 [Epsilonproteobacteria bacterium]|nr:MAG: hypothetical protein DRQ89_14425 [Campylobacterota bacterium]
MSDEATRDEDLAEAIARKTPIAEGSYLGTNRLALALEIAAALRSARDEERERCAVKCEGMRHKFCDGYASEDDAYWEDDNRDDIHSHGVDIGLLRAAKAIREGSDQ